MGLRSESFATQLHMHAVNQNDGERNQVITPYNHSDAKIFYDRNNILIHQRPIELADGTQYNVTSSQITKHLPDGLEGIAYHEAVAFCTKPEGLYIDRLIKMAKLGIEGTVVSSPQNFGKYFTFNENTHNNLSIIHNEALEFGRDPDYVNLAGISQGAMYANGLLSLAHEHDITPLAAHLNVPCLPDGLRPCDAWETLKNAPNELKSIGTYTKMGASALFRLAPTVDFSVEATYVQTQCLPALLSGETGRHARKISTDPLVMVEVFLGDFLSRGRVWRDKVYKNKPNVKVVAKNGGSHMECVNPDSQTSFIDYQTAIATTLRENPRIRSNSQTAAHELYEKVLEQYPQYKK